MGKDDDRYLGTTVDGPSKPLTVRGSTTTLDMPAVARTRIAQRQQLLTAAEVADILNLPKSSRVCTSAARSAARRSGARPPDSRPCRGSPQAGLRRSVVSVRYDEARKRYRATWYDAAGDRHRRWFSTKHAAEQAHALGRLLNPRARNRSLPRPSSLTLATYGSDYVARRSPELAGATVRNYAYVLRLVEKGLGAMPLRQIDAAALRGTLDRLRSEGRKPSSVRGIRRVLRTILRSAVAEGLLHADPTIEPHRRVRGGPSRRTSPRSSTRRRPRRCSPLLVRQGVRTTPRSRC